MVWETPVKCIINTELYFGFKSKYLSNNWKWHYYCTAPCHFSDISICYCSWSWLHIISALSLNFFCLERTRADTGRTCREHAVFLTVHWMNTPFWIASYSSVSALDEVASSEDGRRTRTRPRSAVYALRPHRCAAGRRYLPLGWPQRHGGGLQCALCLWCQ